MVSHDVSHTRRKQTHAAVQTSKSDCFVFRHFQSTHLQSTGLSNSENFCDELLTGLSSRVYFSLVDAPRRQSRPGGSSYSAQVKATRAYRRNNQHFCVAYGLENCPQIHSQLLRCVSKHRFRDPRGLVSLSPHAAHSRRTREVKTMTSLLRISDVEKRLCVSRSTVNRLIRKRKLECVYIGSSPRIVEESIEQFIEELRGHQVVGPNAGDDR